MDGSQLEAWAVSKAAQNTNHHPGWKPVILYRNGEANGMGALSGGTHLLTAGHLFTLHMPPCFWSYALLLPQLSDRRPLVSANSFADNPKADLAVCSPGSIVHVSKPLPNFFYQGANWGGELVVDVRKEEDGFKALTSTISGERLISLGSVVYDTAPYEVLDYASMPGESGTILWDENDSKSVYILKGDSPVAGEYFRKAGRSKSGRATLALRLSIA